MTAKTPPVPPASQQQHGQPPRDSANPSGVRDKAARQEAPDPDKQGQQGNIRQNTRNQGYQQDR